MMIAQFGFLLKLLNCTSLEAGYSAQLSILILHLPHLSPMLSLGDCLASYLCPAVVFV